MGANVLTPDEQKRVDAAIADAQAKTRARFAVVVVRASDRYRFYPVLWGVITAFAAFGLIALLNPFLPPTYPHIGLRMTFAVVTAIFLVISLVLEWAPLRLGLVPRHVKNDHARALAHREFAVRILSHADRQGGVLFFVSLAERYAEVIADHALHQAAGQEAWDRIVADFTSAAARGQLADGFVAGAEACGALLEQHQPKPVK
jgi:putative membrane protein